MDDQTGRVDTRRLVKFRGAGAGVGDLTWAQLGIWQTMVRTGLPMNIGGVVPMPPGTTVEEIAAILGLLVSRHPALRTRLRFGPGGPPEQVLCEAGEVPLEILDGGDDPAATAESLRARYEQAPFDYEHEYPVRMGVVCRGDAVSHTVVIYCHVAVDGFGIDALVRDMALYDPATGTASAPPPEVTPLSQAAKQATPAGRRQSDKSLRHWEQVLRALPAERFAEHQKDPRTPRYWELTLRSKAMHLAMQVVSHRTGIGVGYVVLAAYAVALARRTGRHPSVAQLVVSNRFRPGCADTVNQLAQLSICTINTEGSDTEGAEGSEGTGGRANFDDVVRQAWNAATNAYMHGFYDPKGLTELLRRIEAERGPVEIEIIVNDRRTRNGAPPLGDLPEPGAVRAALAETTSWWPRKVDALDATLNISVDAAPGGDAVDLTVCADTHRLGPAEIEALAVEMERVAVEAV